MAKYNDQRYAEHGRSILDRPYRPHRRGVDHVASIARNKQLADTQAPEDSGVIMYLSPKVVCCRRQSR